MRFISQKMKANIFVKIDGEEGKTNEIRVGGRVRLVFTGTLYLK